MIFSWEYCFSWVYFIKYFEHNNNLWIFFKAKLACYFSLSSTVIFLSCSLFPLWMKSCGEMQYSLSQARSTAKHGDPMQAAMVYLAVFRHMKEMDRCCHFDEYCEILNDLMLKNEDSEKLITILTLSRELFPNHPLILNISAKFLFSLSKFLRLVIFFINLFLIFLCKMLHWNKSVFSPLWFCKLNDRTLINLESRLLCGCVTTCTSCD